MEQQHDNILKSFMLFSLYMIFSERIGRLILVILATMAAGHAGYMQILGAGLLALCD